MIEKFERLEEPRENNSSTESILFSLVFFFLVVLTGLWFYQNNIMEESDYIRGNEIKLLENKQKDLQDEINKVLQENARLKREKNTASILKNI